MRRFAFEIVAELTSFAELFLVEETFRANAEKRPSQLVVMGVAVRKAVVVDEYLKLAFAQRRAVEMRKVIHSGPGGMHGRLVHQMYLAKEARRARSCAG